jgi:HEAT repeat protein
MAALLLSRDAGIPQMCKRLLQHEESDVRQVAALGLGALKDTKSVQELGELLYEPFPGVHQAASLALVSIGTQAALEAVASAMLHGDENHQRACAESLANHVEDGYPVLKEASTFDDLMARRAAVYGLARIQEPWAREIIDQVRAQDKEWIVRNSAEEISSYLEQGSPFLPEQYLPLHEKGWLLVFAAKSGEGVPPGPGAQETFQRALVGGNDAERTAAMHNLKFLSKDAGESAISLLYSIFLQERDELQESAYLALWYLAISGHSLPSPIKFGIGTQNW